MPSAIEEVCIYESLIEQLQLMKRRKYKIGYLRTVHDDETHNESKL